MLCTLDHAHVALLRCFLVMLAGASMLLGAVVAWAILGPLAHRDGWVSLPGSKQPDDATGWLAWVALPIMLMDSVVRAAYVLCAVLPSHPRSPKLVRCILCGTIAHGTPFLT